MSKIPPSMRRNGRPGIPHFHREEFLYRRVPLWMWDDPAQPVDVNAIELPDISVGRSRFGHPEWMRVDEVQGQPRYFEGWGVIGFQHQDIPPERWLVGVFHFTFETHHDPEDWNYPHSEVRVFDNGHHVKTLESLPDEVHLEWRELLLRRLAIFLKPFQPARMRPLEPVSHIPELPIPEQ